MTIVTHQDDHVPAGAAVFYIWTELQHTGIAASDDRLSATRHVYALGAETRDNESLIEAWNTTNSYPIKVAGIIDCDELERHVVLDECSANAGVSSGWFATRAPEPVA